MIDKRRYAAQPATQQLILRMVRDADALKQMTRRELRTIHVFLASVRDAIIDAIQRAEGQNNDEH